MQSTISDIEYLQTTILILLGSDDSGDNNYNTMTFFVVCYFVVVLYHAYYFSHPYLLFAVTPDDLVFSFSWFTLYLNFIFWFLLEILMIKKKRDDVPGEDLLVNESDVIYSSTEDTEETDSLGFSDEVLCDL